MGCHEVAIRFGEKDYSTSTNNWEPLGILRAAVQRPMVGDANHISYQIA